MKHSFKGLWLFFMVSVFLLSGCAPKVSETPVAPEPQISETVESDEIEKLNMQLTIREKVGQMFMICPDSLDLSQTPEQISDPSIVGVTELSEEMNNTLKAYPVIGSRAFSSDAAAVAEMAKAMAEGLKQQQIIPVYKHFPGHGDTAEDSHSKIAVSYKTKKEMETCEWLPYESLTSAECVMVGHIAAPNITGDLTPATMSQEIIRDILREQLGFEGVVITDSLEMGAITEAYTSAEAVIQAIEAGCDILLMPENFQEAFEAVVESVENGTISEKRIDESVCRILQLKNYL